MTVREDLESRIAAYEAEDTIVGDAMAIACRGAMLKMSRKQLEAMVQIEGAKNEG